MTGNSYGYQSAEEYYDAMRMAQEQDEREQAEREAEAAFLDSQEGRLEIAELALRQLEEEYKRFRESSDAKVNALVEALGPLKSLGSDIDLDYTVDTVAVWSEEVRYKKTDHAKKRFKEELVHHSDKLLEACRALIVIRNSARAALKGNEDGD